MARMDSWATRKKKPAPAALSSALSRLVRKAYSPKGEDQRPHVGDHDEERGARRMGNAERLGGGDELARIPEGDGGSEGQNIDQQTSAVTQRQLEEAAIVRMGSARCEIRWTAQRLSQRQRLPGGGHIVHPEEPGPPLLGQGACRRGGAISVLDRRPVTAAQEALARGTDQQRPAQRVQRGKLAHGAADVLLDAVLENPSPGSSTVILLSEMPAAPRHAFSAVPQLVHHGADDIAGVIGMGVGGELQDRRRASA